MRVIYKSILIKLVELFDVFVIFTSFVVSRYALRLIDGGIAFSSFLSQELALHDIFWIVLLLLLWNITCSSSGLYKSKRLISFTEESTEIFKAILICMVIVLIVIYVTKGTMLSFSSLSIFLVIATVLMILFRFIIRIFLRFLRLINKDLKHVLVIGTNKRAEQFAAKITDHPELGYRLIGFVDQQWKECEHLKKKGYTLCADFQTVFHFIRHNVIDEVFIMLPLNSYYEWTSKFILQCEDQGILVRFSPEIFSRKQDKFLTAEHFYDLPCISYHSHTIHEWRLILKRAFDFTASLLLLLLTAPLFLFVAVAIKITSPGPVFFRQTRLGLNKRKFMMLKFRTMVQNAEQLQKSLEGKNEMKGPVFKIKEDPRITKIGKFLRKTSIDELPQLINVLQGDMSIVGPRPLPLRDYNGFDQDYHRRRLSVKPGITCIWQISGRNTVAFEEWMKMDLDYIDRWSLALDFRILFQTFFIVLRGTGAF